MFQKIQHSHEKKDADIVPKEWEVNGRREAVEEGIDYNAHSVVGSML